MQRMNQWLVRVLVGTCVALALSFVAGGTVSAHSRLKSSSPADGSHLTSAPTTVSAVYGEDTSLTGSKFDLYYAKTSGDAPTLVAGGKVDVNDRTQMRVDLPAGSGDGIYTVKWHTLTEDDNGQADGSFSFTVGAPPAGSTGNNSGTSAMSKGDSTSNSGSMSNSGSALPQTGNPATGLLWLAWAGLLVLGSGLAVRRRSA